MQDRIADGKGARVLLTIIAALYGAYYVLLGGEMLIFAAFFIMLMSGLYALAPLWAAILSCFFAALSFLPAASCSPVMIVALVAAAVICALPVRKGVPFNRGCLFASAYIAALLAAALLYAVCVTKGALSPGLIVEFLRDTIGSAIREAAALYSAAELSDSSIFSNGIEYVSGVAINYSFGTAILVSVIVGFAGVLGARLCLSLAGRPQGSVFAAYKVSKIGAGLFAAALVLSIFSGTVGIVAGNFVLAMLPALVLEGAGFAGYLVTTKFRGMIGIWMLALLLLAMSPFVGAIAAAVLGVVDAFGSWRKIGGDNVEKESRT